MHSLLSAEATKRTAAESKKIIFKAFKNEKIKEKWMKGVLKTSGNFEVY